MLKSFSPAAGGMLCPDCSAGENDCLILSGEVLALLRLMLTGNLTTLQRVRASTVAQDKLESFLERYLEYHLERRFNMKNTIRILKKMLS